MLDALPDARRDATPAPRATSLLRFFTCGSVDDGKSTLIGRLLRDPGFARTAVIVNEFGEIGLDHELIASSSETLLALGRAAHKTRAVIAAWLSCAPQ